MNLTDLGNDHHNCKLHEKKPQPDIINLPMELTMLLRKQSSPKQTPKLESNQTPRYELSNKVATGHI